MIVLCGGCGVGGEFAIWSFVEKLRLCGLFMILTVVTDFMFCYLYIGMVDEKLLKEVEVFCEI